jgi:5-methyltetrahydrofolate--homocysteine methyltransferase
MSLEQLTEAVRLGKRADAKKLTEQAIAEQVPVTQVLDALVTGMDDVGRRFQCNEIFVPEMLMASRAMKESMTLLEPLLIKAGIKPAHIAVIGTVQGDLHDIGKNLVSMMWKGANLGVVDLGTNVPPERFVAAAQEHQAAIVGLSALLTTTMPAMKQAVAALKQAGVKAKVVVGGAPVSQQFAQEIGADGFAADAGTAVDVVRKLLEV